VNTERLLGLDVQLVESDPAPGPRELCFTSHGGALEHRRRVSQLLPDLSGELEGRKLGVNLAVPSDDGRLPPEKLFQMASRSAA
jgi:hypothetical protein